MNLLSLARYFLPYQPHLLFFDKECMGEVEDNPNCCGLCTIIDKVGERRRPVGGKVCLQTLSSVPLDSSDSVDVSDEEECLYTLS